MPEGGQSEGKSQQGEEEDGGPHLTASGEADLQGGDIDHDVKRSIFIGQKIWKNITERGGG